MHDSLGRVRLRDKEVHKQTFSVLIEFLRDTIDSCRVHETLGRIRSRVKEVHK